MFAVRLTWIPTAGAAGHGDVPHLSTRCPVCKFRRGKHRLTRSLDVAAAVKGSMRRSYWRHRRRVYEEPSIPLPQGSPWSRMRGS